MVITAFGDTLSFEGILRCLIRRSSIAITCLTGTRPDSRLVIGRKAASLADVFERQALDQLTKDAASALAAGADPRQVIR